MVTQKTNLNISPYFDDFDESKNFVRTLFRPGSAIQARELTQLQSSLQNQIAKHSDHIFEEGAMVIPGQISFNSSYYSLKLVDTFGGETIKLSQYLDTTNPVVITGATTGVTAKVIGIQEKTTTEQPLLFINYINTGTDGQTSVFADGENLSANISTTHTTSYSANAASLTAFTSTFKAATGSSASQLASATGPASRTGSAVEVQSGVYYVRGHFVQCNTQTIVLDPYSPAPSFRVGFTVEEKLVSSGDDTTLLDNSTGSNNFSARGADRLQINLTLAKLERTSTADSNFIQLMDIKAGVELRKVRNTEYSILEETMARRTFNESGNYTTVPFVFAVDESVTVNDNVGLYTAGDTTDDRNTASTDLLSVRVSPGTAYVRGFEVERRGPTFKDVNKARTFDTVNASITMAHMGSYVNVTNVYNSPDIGAVGTETTPFKEIGLYNAAQDSRGSSGGRQIGVARSRGLEYSTGVAGTTTATYKLFLFDVQAFTEIVLSGIASATLTANASSGGLRIKDATTGASGVVYSDGTSGDKIFLTGVTGSFNAGNKITASDRTGNVTDGTNDLTIKSVFTHSFADVRSVHMSGSPAFSADIQVDSFTQLSKIVLEDSDKASAGVLALDGTDTSSSDVNEPVTYERTTFATLRDIDKNLAFYNLPENIIKTHLTTSNSGVSDLQFTVKKQFVGNTNSSGVITFTTGGNETFVSFAEKHYTLTVMSAGGGSAVAGDVILLTDKTSGSGTNSLTITDNTLLGNNAKVKLTASVLRTSVPVKSKTTKLMKQLKVTTGTTDAFGTRPDDDIISLGRADVFDIVGIFDSGATLTAATAPELNLTTISGTFIKGEKITGGSSGATARIIDISSPMSYVLSTSIEFVAGETITGDASAATATITSDGLTTGSELITSRYLFDSGRRANFYDISRLILKAGSPKPSGQLLIVYNYFEHGAGDCFTVDSYSDVGKQMEFVDIPTATIDEKIRADERADKRANVGYDSYKRLNDFYDFRPRVEDITGASSNIDTVDEITGFSFDFKSRQYDGTGASVSSPVQPSSNIQSDFEFYLPRISTLSMSQNGRINVTDGVPDRSPRNPTIPSGDLPLATLLVPAFTYRPQDVQVRRHKHQRYTMKDIGDLEERIANLEFVTTLNSLERSTASFEILDSNGLNRFKSGFLVDNFTGHKVGDTKHPDYKIAIDMEEYEARPIHSTKAVRLAEDTTLDSVRTSKGYKKTGDLITLNYSEVLLSENPFASRVERVMPLLTSSWIGEITLDPFGDEWFETEIAPELVIELEGNFQAVLDSVDNIGTVWSAWNVAWRGQPTTSDRRRWNTGREITVGGRGEWAEVWAQGFMTNTQVGHTRTRTTTSVVEQIDRESQGFRVISRGITPYIRPNTVKFTGTGFRPNTFLHAFFDKQNVNAYITPDSGFSSDATIVKGSQLLTSANGSCNGTFDIPDPKIAGNPQIKSGQVLFRLTSSSTDARGRVATAETDTGDATPTTLFTSAEAIYEANGILETMQETIHATRNGRIVREVETESRTTTESFWTEQEEDPGDPIAQTFMVEGIELAGDGSSDDRKAMEIGSTGRFITSLDLYFSEKDDTLPIKIEIRNVVNGYPGPKVVPFSNVTKFPADVNVSSDASVATTFTFKSPVYLMPNMEYCIVALTNTIDYKVWISRMHEEDVTSDRQISEQPHIGVLFKSHNNSAFAISPLEDLKFTLRRAKFSTEPATVTLENKAVETRTLGANPIIMNDDSATALKIKVNHRNHHMYSTSNNVTIDGVISGASTTLNGAISATETGTITLASGSNFDDTTGKYAQTAAGVWHIKINDEIITYTSISTNSITGGTITRGVDGTTAAAHATGSTVELYQAYKVPFTEINKTHTDIDDFGLDYYTLTLSTTPVIDGVADAFVELGGKSVTATENAQMCGMSTMIGTIQPPSTGISLKARPTTSTSPSGTETSFSKTSEANAFNVPLNEDFFFDEPQMVASAINEANEMSSNKSFTMPITLTTESNTVSPVIDMGRASVFAIANRLDKITAASNVWPDKDDATSLASMYQPSTVPEGDPNAAIYITKPVRLKNPAQNLRVLFAAVKPGTSDLKLMFRTLRLDEDANLGDKDFIFFNDDGSPDDPIVSSDRRNEFLDVEYSAGITDDGLGTPLDEFTEFQIKILMQGTKCTQVPRLKDFRVLALAT